MKNNPLIVSLIKDDLINAKLINGLNNLGLNAGMYYLNLSDTIFVLLGITENKEGEKLFEHYLMLRNEAVAILDLKTYPQALNDLANEIYQKLKKK